MGYLDGYSAFSLISSAIPGKRKIRINIVKDRGYICIGLAQKKQIVETGYRWPSDFKGVYVIRGKDGYVRNICDTDEHRKESLFRFSSGDTVEMDYNPSQHALRVENKTKSTSHTLRKIRW